MSTLVIHYYITNHPKLCALNQPLFYYCSQVCVSTGGSCAVRRYTDGVEGVSRLVVQDGLIYISGFQVGTGCWLGQQERASPHVQPLFKCLLASHLLVSHCPKQVTQQSPELEQDKHTWTSIHGSLSSLGASTAIIDHQISGLGHLIWQYYMELRREKS